MRPTLLSMDHGYPGQMDAMHESFEILRLKGPDPEALLQRHRTDIQGITTSLTPVRKNLIAALPNLEIIAVGAAGLDHVDTEFAAERNIVVTHTPDVLTEDTADLAYALILSLMRRVVEGDAAIRAGLWHKGSFPLGVSLTSKTLGIVGMGRIGRAIARKAAAFGMKVVWFGPSEKPELPYNYYGDITTLARHADILVLACPGGEKTRHLIDAQVLEALGPQGFLVNIARGSVVKTEDLLIALNNRSIAGAALDVFDNEPTVPEGLLTMDRVVLTPHIGSATIETRTRMGRQVVEQLKTYFSGQVPAE